jgi:HTH-type transcriptional regulator / antitoxin HipB
MNHSHQLLKTPAQLGAVIRNRRLALGLDQQSLARKAGISRAWLLALEKGKAGASIGIILKVLSALDISLLVSMPEGENQERAPSPDSSVRRVDLNAWMETLRKTRQ